MCLKTKTFTNVLFEKMSSTAGFHIILYIDIVFIVSKSGKSILPDSFQISKGLFLSLLDTVYDLHGHAWYPPAPGKVSAQLTTGVHNLLPVPPVPEVHGLCGAPCVLLGTL